MRPALGRQSIILVKPAVIVDSRDNTQNLSYAEGEAEFITVNSCSVQPVDKQEEISAERDFSLGSFSVWAPYSDVTTGIEAHDHVQYLGVEYEVFGQVMPWIDLQGNPHHVKFVIISREG